MPQWNCKMLICVTSTKHTLWLVTFSYCFDNHSRCQLAALYVPAAAISIIYIPIISLHVHKTTSIFSNSSRGLTCLVLAAGLLVRF